MRDHQFDVAPVLEEETPVGIFHTSDIEEARPAQIAKTMRPLAASHIVSGDAPLSDLMDRMVREPFLFVLDGTRITGFVTPADLGTIPVRTHFYLRLANLESVLGNYLRAKYPDQRTAVACLSSKRQNSQAGIAEDLRSKDRFIDEISCLSLDDMVVIAGKDQIFREEARKSGIGWRRATRGLAEFRNDIMHPGRILADSEEFRPGRLLDWEKHLHALTHAAEALAAVDRDLADSF